MKIYSIFFLCLFAILTTRPGLAQSGGGQIPLINRDVTVPVTPPRGLENALAIGQESWWGRHYVAGLGLSLFDEHIVAVPKLDFQGDKGDAIAFNNGGLKRIDPSKVRYAYADAIPARRGADGSIIPISTASSQVGGAPLVFLRIQDDLTSKPFDAQPGTVIWEHDRQAGSQSTMINAAVLADVYFAGLDMFGRYTSDAMFHLLAGAEIERFDTGNAATDIDIRRYTAAAEFSPGAILGLPSINNQQLRQTMTLGWTFEDNAAQDVQRHSFQLKYAPSFKLPFFDLFVGERSYYRKFFDFINPKERDDEKAAVLNNLFAANQSAIQGDKAEGLVTHPAVAASNPMTPRPATSPPKLDNFFYLRPRAGIDYGQSSVSGLFRGDLPDLNLVYTVETGLSLMKESFQLGYRINGFWGLDGGSNRLSHEFFLQATPHGWPGRVFATYKQGRVAPSFTEVDVFQVGIGLKF